MGSAARQVGSGVVSAPDDTLAGDELYFDGHCPLCVAEMGRLRRLAGPGLHLLDIHSLTDLHGLPAKEDMLGTLHLRRDAKVFLTGMDANVAAWQHTRFGWLWRPLRWPVIRVAADLLYRHWARWRYRRLYGSNPARL
jgi:predicted DCC family thiol-disulfide oxidoreductase YuxK